MVQIALAYTNKAGETVHPDTYPETLEFPDLYSENDVTFEMVRGRIVDLMMEGRLKFRRGIKIKWCTLDDSVNKEPVS